MRLLFENSINSFPSRCTFHTCSGPARLESRPIVFIMSSATRCVGRGSLECDSLWPNKLHRTIQNHWDQTLSAPKEIPMIQNLGGWKIVWGGVTIRGRSFGSLPTSKLSLPSATSFGTICCGLGMNSKSQPKQSVGWWLCVCIQTYLYVYIYIYIDTNVDINHVDINHVDVKM